MGCRWVLLLSVMTLLLAGCHGEGGGLIPPATTPEPEILSGSGVIQFVNVEGGCWVIRSTDGNRYEPINLSDPFRKDGLAVRYVLKTRPDILTICMVGRPVEVIDMQAVAAP